MTPLCKTSRFAALAACTILSAPAFAGGEPAQAEVQSAETLAKAPVNSLEAAIKNGTTYIDLRYRLENVDQDSFADDATASTLRTKLGYKTGEWNNLSVGLEFENVVELGADDYNDTINGQNRPTIADPEVTHVNQVYLSFTGIEDSVVNIGRQPINLGNQRYVGTVAWRQNDQMFDSIVAVNNSIDKLTAIYAYVDEVQRINGDEHALGQLDTGAHFVDLTYALNDNLTLRGYGYWWEVDDVAALSSNTYGIRGEGKYGLNDDISLTYAGEYARQGDYGNNTANYDANYYLAELGLAGSNWDVTLGYEVLGADGTNGVFTTPLATGHKFNGWTDKFLNTPANGLEDLYLTASYKFKAPENVVLDKLKVVGHYHQFDSEQNSVDYGSEVAVKLHKPINDNYWTAVKYANYNADQFSSDTQKAVFMLGAKF